MRGQYFSPAKLESLAYDLLARYERKKGSPVRRPVRAETIAESVGLNILWDRVPEKPGTTTCGVLIPDERLIVLNERRLALFEDTPGLYNTVVGHELGHWWLHVDHDALNHSSLPDVVYSSAPAPQNDGRDKGDESNAGGFMGYLLMPSALLLPRLDGLDLQSWPALYRLRDEFEVTVSAMRVRLEKLGLTHLDSKGRFHKSKQAAEGQGTLF